MKHTVKKICGISLIFAILLNFSVMGSAADTTARLYNIYGNSMLFRQNTEAVFAGEGTCGALIEAELIEGDTVIAHGQSKVSDNGKFEVSFMAPDGSYTEYDVKLYVSGKQFAKLKNVVFGELWLASGQSNMQYGLAQSYRGAEMMTNGETGSKWLRVFSVPAITQFDGAEGSAPVDPKEEIIGCKWFDGTQSADIGGVSAVAFFFAEKLIKDIDMPVGILNSSLGGSAIASWLSRDAIDCDESVKNDFISTGTYIEKSAWDKNKQSQYYDMTSNFNLKIYPMRFFRPSGMIWYQGETDIIYKHINNYYTRAFDLLQRSYSELFGFTDGLMPIIYTQLASYYYFGGNELQDMNAEFTAMQTLRPQSRAMITTYDIPLDYLSGLGSIHPGTKQPIGERMEYAAMGLIYGNYDTYTAASVINTSVKDGSIYVTFAHTGKGLVISGDGANDFSVCGNDGIYCKAKAEIVSADTVKIYSEYIQEPVSATYGYSLMNSRANLFAIGENDGLVPVAPFKTADIKNAHYRTDATWMDCTSASVWHTGAGEEGAYYPTWSSSMCTTTFLNGKMEIFSEYSRSHNTFTVSPVISYKDKFTTKQFKDCDYDLSDYGSLTITLQNTGDADITLKEIRIYTGSALWFTPECMDSGDTAYTLKADGNVYSVRYDLNKLWLHSNEGGAVYSNANIKNIKDIKIIFENASGSAGNINIDEIIFTPETPNLNNNPIGFINNFNAVDSLLEAFSAVFSAFFKIISDFLSPFIKEC